MSTNNSHQNFKEIYQTDEILRFERKKALFMIFTISVYVGIIIQGTLILFSESLLNQLSDLSQKNRIQKFCIIQITVSSCLIVLHFIILKISSRRNNYIKIFSYFRGLIQLLYVALNTEIAIIPYLKTENESFITLSATILFELMLFNVGFILFELNTLVKSVAFFLAILIIIIRLTHIELICLIPSLAITTVLSAYLIIDQRANQEILKQIYLHNRNGEIYQSFLDLLPEGVAMIKEKNNLVYVNNSMKRILGCPEENIINCILDLVNINIEGAKEGKKEAKTTNAKSNSSIGIPDDGRIADIKKNQLAKRTFQQEDLKNFHEIECQKSHALINKNDFCTTKEEKPSEGRDSKFNKAKSDRSVDKQEDRSLRNEDRSRSDQLKARESSLKSNMIDKDKNEDRESILVSGNVSQNFQTANQSKSSVRGKNLYSIEKFRMEGEEETKQFSPSLKNGFIRKKTMQIERRLSSEISYVSAQTRRNNFFTPTHTGNISSKFINLQDPNMQNRNLSYQAISPRKSSAESINEAPIKSNQNIKLPDKSSHDSVIVNEDKFESTQNFEKKPKKSPASSPASKLIESSSKTFYNESSIFKKTKLLSKEAKDFLQKAGAANTNGTISEVKTRTRILKSYSTTHADIRTTFDSLMNRLRDDRAETAITQSLSNNDTKKQGTIYRFFRRLFCKNREKQTLLNIPRTENDVQKVDGIRLGLDEEDCCIFVNSKLKISDKKERLLEVKLSPTFIDTKPCVLVLIRDTTERDLLNRLQETDNYKNTLMASVSHELRTPLNCIITMQEMLRKHLNQELIDSYLNPSINSSKLLLSLVNDILDFAQIRAGKLRLTFEEFNLHEMLKETLTLFEIQSKNRNVELRFEWDSRVPTSFHSDPNRIRQIVLNLLGNAIKFTYHGFIALKTVYKGTNRVCIMVRDTGTGIKKEHFSKMFLSFNKIDNQMNPHGAGLGLSISQTLARRLGPKDARGIKVQSKYGKGSCFFFMIESVAKEKGNKTKEINEGYLGEEIPVEEEKFEEENSENEQESDSECSGSPEDDIEDRLSDDDDVIRPIKNIEGLNKMMEAPEKNKNQIDFQTNQSPKNPLKLPESQSLVFLATENDDGKDRDKQVSISRLDTIEINTVNLNDLPINAFERERYRRPNFRVSVRQAINRLEDNQNDRQINKLGFAHSFQDKNPTKSDVASSIEVIQTKTIPKMSDQEVLINNQVLRDSLKYPLKKNRSSFDNSKFKETLSIHVDEKDKHSFKQNQNFGSSNFLSVGKNNTSNYKDNGTSQSKLNMLVGGSPKSCKCEDILIVDDSDFNLLALKGLLDSLEYKVAKAHNGQIAINLILQKQKSSCCKSFCVVFMDCDMPVKNGFQATKELKEMQRKGQIPVFPIIAATAFVNKREVDLCFESGMDEYLNKPIIKNKLEQVLKKWYKK